MADLKVFPGWVDFLAVPAGLQLQYFVRGKWKVEKVFFSPVGGQHRFVNIPRDLVMPSWLHRSLAFHLHDWGDHDCLVHISS